MADLKEEVFKLVNDQPERKMLVMAIQNRICEQFVEHHSGEVRLAIRLLLDENRAILVPGNILILS